MKMFEQLTKFRPPPKASGVQREVLNLYRKFLRAAKEKPESERNSTLLVVRQKFREKSMIPRTNMESIEFHLEQGYRQLNQLKRPQVSSMSFVTIKRDE